MDKKHDGLPQTCLELVAAEGALSRLAHHI